MSRTSLFDLAVVEGDASDFLEVNFDKKEAMLKDKL